MLPAVPHQCELHGELHVGERAVAELEREPSRVRGLHAFGLDADAHPADLGDLLDRQELGVGEVRGERLEPPP